MSIYTLAFRDDARPSEAYGPEERLGVAAELMATIGAGDPEALLALPAGFVVAPSAARRDEWAEGLAVSSRNAGVAVVVGIDVADREKWGVEGCPRSFVYATDRGRRLLWGAAPATRAAALVERTITLAGLRVTLLFGRELFATRSTAAVDVARPDLVLVVGHGGPTRKWAAPLLALDAMAPTLVVHQSLPVRRPLQLPPPRGWRPTTSRGAIRIACYRREPMAPARASWETKRP